MAREVKDRTKEKYGRLKPKSYFFEENNKGKKIVFWLCDCDCGNTDIKARGTDLGRSINSCGCLIVEGNRTKAENNKTHGMHGTKFYKIWRAMIDRCTNENLEEYKNYGGRGISVDGDWLIFENFYNDMFSDYENHICEYGENNTSIEREDVNKNYTKSNCKWETWHNQSRNRRNNRPFVATHDVFGIFHSKVAKDFALEHGLDDSCIIKCLKGKRKKHKGWTFNYSNEDPL